MWVVKSKKENSGGKKHRTLKKDVPSEDEDSVDNFMAELDAMLNNNSDDVSNYTEYLYPFSSSNSQKLQCVKPKMGHYSAEILVELEDRDDNIVPICALLDTGMSATLLLHKFVKKGSAKGHKALPTKWHTLGGTFVTHRKALMEFKFPELSTSKKVQWKTHVDHVTDPKHAAYDMIIGMDLMTEIGIFVNTADKQIHWEEAFIPLKQRGDLNDPEYIQLLYEYSTAPEVLFEAEDRQSRILDAHYEKVDIDDLVDNLDNIEGDQKSTLKCVLKSHPQLFSGGLGTLNVKPIHLELNEDAVPYHARAFPIPQLLRQSTKCEMDRLTNEDVFEKDYESEWAALTFVK